MTTSLERSAGRTGTEIVLRGIQGQWRSARWWTLGIVALALVTVAFWPSIEGTSAFSELEQSSPTLLEAFGAQGISTPAGYLDGQLYALMLPLLLSGLCIASATAVTSGDEDAGRLELLQALPVARQALWFWRFVSAVAVLALVAVVTAAVVVITLGPFSLSEVGAGTIVSATLACALLGAFHGALAYAVGGFGGSRGRAVGVAILVLVAGYVVNFLFPLSDPLAGLRVVSPWHWAIGEQPVTNGVEAGGVVLLLVVTALVVAIGTVAVGRRDIRGA